MPAPRKYPDELRQRAVKLYRASDPKPVIRRLAEQLGVHPEALRNWIHQDQADTANDSTGPPRPRPKRSGGCVGTTRNLSVLTKS